MKIAAVVIIYNPDDTVIKNISSYSGFVDRTYVLDNSEKNNSSFENLITKVPNCQYIAYKENKGIGIRLNQAAAMARKDGFTFLLTMDQDSSFGEQNFQNYLQKIKDYNQSTNGAAVFAVNFQPELIAPTVTPVKILSTITSGSVIDVEMHKLAGGYNEELFIDLVDAEYCYKIDALGYSTILFPDIILTHNIGYLKKGRSLKNFKVTSRGLHSPVRLYYLVRNGLFLLNRKNLQPAAKKEIKKCLWLSLKNNLLYHDNKSGIIKYIIKGYIDYKKNKLGKINQN